MNTRLQLVSDNSASSVGGVVEPAAEQDALPFVTHPKRSANRPCRLRARLADRRLDDEGAVTAEYAVVIIAAIALGGVLVAIMRSPEIRTMLVDLVQNALGTAGS